VEFLRRKERGSTGLTIHSRACPWRSIRVQCYPCNVNSSVMSHGISVQVIALLKTRKEESGTPGALADSASGRGSWVAAGSLLRFIRYPLSFISSRSCCKSRPYYSIDNLNSSYCPLRAAVVRILFGYEMLSHRGNA
jgi:hypothetical protein